MQINVGCGPFRAPSPWVNVDVIHLDGHIEPDIVVPSMWPADWDLTGFTKVYMGHVLEHIQWERVPEFLQQVLDKCEDGAEIAIVCPDITRFLARWKAGTLEWEDVAGALEHHLSFQPAGTWDGARHQWNAYGKRLVDVAIHAGLANVREVTVHPAELDGWPVTSFVDTQCCVLATKLA